MRKLRWQRGFHRRRRRSTPAAWLLPGFLVVLAGSALLWHSWPTVSRVGAHLTWGPVSAVAVLFGGLATVLWGVFRWQSTAARRRGLARSARLRAMQTMDPLAFERQVGVLFERSGSRVSYTAHSGDDGIDLWVEGPGQPGGRSRLLPWKALVGGARAGRIPVQCKRYGPDHAVGSPELQRFSGALRRVRAETGLFVTTSRFTPAARAWARKEGIHLLDGAALARWQARLLPQEQLAALARSPEAEPGPTSTQEAGRGEKGRHPR